MQEHPGFLNGVAVWIAVGAMVYVVALAGLLYSEIRACLIVRDQDFRVRLLETQVCVPGSRLADLKENESALLAPRAYIAFVCLLLFVLAIAAMLFPLCDIFSIVGTCASRVEHLRPVRGQHASYATRAACAYRA